MTTAPRPIYVIRRTLTGWTLDMRDAPDAADIQRLFGTTTLPMPFTVHADEQTVRQAAERQNPGVVILTGAR